MIDLTQEQGRIKGSIAGFQSIRKRAGDLLEEINEISKATIENAIRGNVSEHRTKDELTSLLSVKNRHASQLVEEFNKFVLILSSVTGNKSYESFLTISFQSGEASLSTVIIKCDFAIGLLDEKVNPTTPEVRNKLQDLKDQLSKISERIDDPNFEKNIMHAIEACERGHNLSSGLISGRVVGYIIQNIPPKGSTPLDEKVKYLQKEGIITEGDKETESLFLKADKDSRNVVAHQIYYFPETADALSLLGDSVRLLDRIWIKLQNHENKQH